MFKRTIAIGKQTYSYFTSFEPMGLLCIYTPPFILLATKTIPLKWSLPFKTIPLAASFNSDLEMQSIAKFLPHGKTKEFD